MSNYTTWKITYTISAQDDGEFSVPKQICDLLNTGSGEMLRVCIRNGNMTLHTEDHLREERKFYGEQFKNFIKQGDELRVTVARI